jgi:hypothetical protein
MAADVAAAVIVAKVFGPGLKGQGCRTSSRRENQAMCRSRSASSASGWMATGRSPLLGVGGLPQGRVGLGVQSPNRARVPGSVAVQGLAVGVQRQARAQRGRAGSGGRCY